MKDFDSTYANNFMAAIEYLRKAGRFVRLVKIFGTILGAALVATSPMISGLQFDGAETYGNYALVVGIVLTVLGSMILVFADATTPEVLSENLQLSRKSKLDNESFEYLDGFIDHQLTRVSLNSYLRELIESAVTEGCSSPDDLKKYARSILGLIVERKASLFGMDDEEWNFAVYYYSKSTEKLECLACRRATDIPPDHVHRSWDVGEGHVGLAFSRSNELIFSDATRDELRPVIGAKGAKLRDYDEEKYKSLASMPISTDGEHPLGILIATSDRIGRFKNEAERGDRDWEREDVLREVAAYLAILFKLIHDDRRSGGNENGE
jgi:hypothetical protein